MMLIYKFFSFFFFFVAHARENDQVTLIRCEQHYGFFLFL